MKFATVLRNSADELPDAAELFTLYKHLKKSLKRIPCGEGFQDDTSLVGELASGVGEAGSGDDELTGLGQPSSGPEVEVASREAALPAAERASLDESEQAFVAELTQDVDQLNEQYMEKEELNVIRFDALKNELQGATAPGKLLSVHRALVDFHGELLLVLHWSVLAYTGLVKVCVCLFGWWVVGGGYGGQGLQGMRTHMKTQSVMGVGARRILGHVL